MFVPWAKLITTMRPITALRIFMFFFVGGLVGLGYDLVGGSSSLVPLVILSQAWARLPAWGCSSGCRNSKGKFSAAFCSKGPERPSAENSQNRH